jgi:hypothetical protein
MPESGTQNTAACGAMAEQTLLVPGVVWRGVGFASWIGCQHPGEHSLKLPPSLYELRRTRGTPGLKYGRPLAFKTKKSVYYAILNGGCAGCATHAGKRLANSHAEENDNRWMP